jgi:tetrahydromethanopterin S-methyltransferase subunit B
MSNVSVLLKGRSLDVSDGVYLERVNEREPILEEYLRSLVARIPKLKSRTRRWGVGYCFAGMQRGNA